MAPEKDGKPPDPGKPPERAKRKATRSRLLARLRMKDKQGVIFLLRRKIFSPNDRTDPLRDKRPRKSGKSRISRSI
jgi:hypothetical protein